MSSQYRLIICTFTATTQAEQARTTLRHLQSAHESLRHGQIALVKHTDQGIEIYEPNDLRTPLSTVAGVVAGGITWLVYAFAGAIGQVAAPLVEFTVSDAVAQAVRDSGFPDDALYAVGKQLAAGSAALVLVATADEEAAIVVELQKLGGTLVQHSIPAAVIAQLEQTFPSAANEL